MSQKIFLMLIKCMFENMKCGHLASLWEGVLVCAYSADADGVEVQNYGKHADVILEQSLKKLRDVQQERKETFFCM